MCVHNGGQLGVGQRHKDMQEVYHVVLSICQACEADGLKHIVRKFKPNGQKKLKDFHKQLARQAMELMRGGCPQHEASASAASASASALAASAIGRGA
eukprot:jgi/Tetstr1/457587/TSEL_044155.t1